MKHRIGLLSLVGAALLTTACPTFNVVFPLPLQTSSQDYKIIDNRIHITVQFNKEVDMSTIVVGKTLILVTERDPNATGVVSSLGPNGILFVTTKTVPELCQFDPDAAFTLKLIGTDTGNGVIKSKSGKVLDGDNDKSAGGDYKTSFTIVG